MKEQKHYRAHNQYSVGDLVRVDASIKHFPIEIGMIIEVYNNVDDISMNDVWEDRWLTQDLLAARGYAYYDVMYSKSGIVEHAVSEIWLTAVPPTAPHVSDNIVLQ
jgi:hypothetical protein